MGKKRDGEEDYLVPKARKLTIVNQSTIKCHFRRTKENEILFSLHNYSPFFWRKIVIRLNSKQLKHLQDYFSNNLKSMQPLKRIQLLNPNPHYLIERSSLFFFPVPWYFQVLLSPLWMSRTYLPLKASNEEKKIWFIIIKMFSRFQ